MSRQELLDIVLSNPISISKEIVFSKRFPEDYKEIISLNFPENFSFKQKLWHYLHNDIELKLGLCPSCGKRCQFSNITKGYRNHCSNKCSKLDPKVETKYNSTCMKKYGVKTYSQSQEWVKKCNENSMEHYGAQWAFQSKEIKEKISTTKQNWSEEKRNEVIMNMKGVWDNKSDGEKEIIRQRKRDIWFNKSDEEKNIINDKIRNSLVNVDEEIKKYRYIRGVETKRVKNEFLNPSTEKNFAAYLDAHNLNYIRQYRCDEYPFFCDFYLPDYKIFVEINGYFTHGGHPFNPLDEIDIQKLEYLKSKSGLNKKF